MEESTCFLLSHHPYRYAAVGAYQQIIIIKTTTIEVYYYGCPVE